MAALPDVAVDHYEQRKQLAEAAAEVTTGEWGKVDRNAIAESWLARLPFVSSIVAAAQLAAAKQAEPYVAEAAGGGAVQALLSAAAFAGVASDGRALLNLLVQPVFAALRALGSGASVPEAMATGHANLDLITRTQVADAGRAADQVAMTVNKSIEGYTRVIVGDTCNRCIILAGRWYPYSAAFKRHHRCDCQMLGASQAEAAGLVQDPMAIYEAMTPAEREDAGWSQNEQKAIALGADIFQVTNAQRSTYVAGQLEFTREGTTVRGLFGGYYIDPDTGRLRRRADSELTKRPSQRVRSSKERRLTPDQILASARDRDHAIQMLRRYAYLLGDPTPEDEPTEVAVQDISGVDVPEPEPSEDEPALSWLDDDDDWGAILEAAAEAKPVDIRDRLIEIDAADPRPTVDINKMVVELGKYVTKKRKAEIDRMAHELFDGVYAGIRARVTETEIDPFSLMTVVRGDLLDADDRKIGHFIRGYSGVSHIDDKGQDLVARHETLELEDRAFQGQGFSEAFNGHLEASYRASGVDRITLTASLDVGRYAWARAGYDFSAAWTAANIQVGLKRLVATYRQSPGSYGGRDLDSVLAKADDILRRFDEVKFGEPDFPSAYELSQLGRWDGASRTDTWLGKEALLKQTWEGVKPITPRAAKPTVRKAVAARPPSEILGASFAEDERAGEFAGLRDWIRSSLADQKRLAGIESILAGNLQTFNGFRPHVDLSGLSVETAKEYAEGILRCAALFSQTKIVEISTFREARDGAFAEVRDGNQMWFNTYWGDSRGRDKMLAALRRSEKQRFNTTGADNALSTAIHEFAHVLHLDTIASRGEPEINELLTTTAARENLDVDQLIRRDISIYAATNSLELVAEAFTDVLMNGDQASELSRGIFDIIGNIYRDMREAGS